jgi:glyoxylase-like metal-dependent hydrolase (beta-lactamase superfamily II)
MILEPIVTAPFQVNAYILGCPQTGKGLVVDPGGDAEDLLLQVHEHHLDILRIVLTHGHLDHFGAAATLQRELDCPIFIHPDDTLLIEHASVQAQMFQLPEPEMFTPQALPVQDDIRFGHEYVQVLETPGHSPGGICLFHPERKILFSGDTLFNGSVGRTDLPGGNGDQLLASIRQKLLTLPPDTIVYPGHGPSTRIERERDHNPFLR